MPTRAGRSTRQDIQTVDLCFHFRDGGRWTVPVIWKSGITVLQALVEAAAHPHGVSFSVNHARYPDFESSAFVIEIDEEPNVHGEWYWVYRVNGEPALIGCDLQTLQPSDIVQWQQVRLDANLAKN